MQYRIICLDDKDEETLHFNNRDGVIAMIREWFCSMTQDGYSSIAQFNKERLGIHCIQVKKNGKWVKAK